MTARTSGVQLRRMAAQLGPEHLDQSIGRRFDALAASRPNKIAIRSPREAITYGDLRTRTDAIARFILEHRGPIHGRPVHVIATLLPQGVDAIAAQLGILKAGACYLPACTSQSQVALRSLAADAGVELAITDSRYLAHARKAFEPEAAVLNIADIPGGATGTTTPLPEVSSDAFAYIYYTSGSTGAPKGVVDTHRNVIHNVLRYTRSLGIEQNDRLTLLQPPSFSGAVSSTYCALLNGATVMPYDLAVDGAECLAGWLAESAVTIYHSVPVIFRNFVAARAAYPSLRYLRLEGDRALAHDARLFQANFTQGCRLVNGLGTTETGLVSQFFIDHETSIDDGVLPIGFPVQDVQCLIIDEDGNPARAGDVGELVVQSEYLAKGYWRDTRSTATKFAGRGRERRYRTGDLGRIRSDGCIEYVGRKGTQRRIRGRFVDIAQIELAICRMEGVADAAVVSVSDSGGDLRLRASVVASDARLTERKLRAALHEVLPDFAVPSELAVNSDLPLTRFGKIDRSALCGAPAVGASDDGQCASPARERTILEAVARIWERALEVKSVNADVPFLDQGGDSLRAMQIVVRVHEEFGVRLSPAAFFELPTVRLQAKHVEAARMRATAASRTAPVEHE